MKIKQHTITGYDFFEMVEEVNRILGYDQRRAGKHFYPDSESSIEWYLAKGYDIHCKDPEQNVRTTKEYKEALAKGETSETPYMDFWHWQLDNCMGHNFQNDTYTTVYIGTDGYLFDEAEPWQLEIQQVWHNTFKHLADEEGHIDIWVSW